MRNNQESVWMLQTKRADFNAIAARFHISPVTARIIRNRDVEGEKAIDRYLNGTLDQLYDPHLMKDMDKAAALNKKLIFAIGNAPTALVRLYELIQEGKLDPELIIGVPVGFVNVVQSKELIMESGAPYIVARGRKGGSNIAACICNALLYMIDNRRD
mgnify:CR=1 FL=1